MTCKVKLFARARDLVDREEVLVTLPEGATVGDLRQALKQDYPQLASLAERSAMAVDNDFASDEARLSEAAEIALLPPVSGGSR